MQGCPVAPGNRVPWADRERAPWNRWSFRHLRKILPTAEARNADHVFVLGDNTNLATSRAG